MSEWVYDVNGSLQSFPDVSEKRFFRHVGVCVFHLLASANFLLRRGRRLPPAPEQKASSESTSPKKTSASVSCSASGIVVRRSLKTVNNFRLGW